MDGARFAVAVLKTASKIGSSSQTSSLSSSSSLTSSPSSKEGRQQKRRLKNEAHAIVDSFMDGDDADAFLTDLRGLKAKREKLTTGSREDGAVITSFSSSFSTSSNSPPLPATQPGDSALVYHSHQQQLALLSPPNSSPSPSPLPRSVLYYVNLVCVLFYNMLLHDAKNVFVDPPSELRSLPFSNCEESDMSEIGSFLYSSIVSNSSPQAAADEYIRQFFCIQRLVEDCPAFKTALDLVVVVTLVKRSPLGANVRLFLGALLSIFDQATDAIMIIEYFKSGNIGFAKALATMLSLNMVVQLFVTWVQHRKMGTKDLLRELFFTVTGLAPGVHAYKVASGHERHSNEAFNPHLLLVFSKCAELVFESVPGLLLQFYVYITLSTSSRFALVSIFTSALTTAFSSSGMYFDKDLDPENRLSDPFFNGIFPDDTASRATAFFSLFILTVAHVLNKALGFALFWVTFGGNAVFLYYGSELAAYFCIKLLRHDMIYWVPTEGTALTVVTAVLDRVANKVLVDFTAFMQFRHPFEAGGLLFTLMLTWSQLSSVISVALYQQYYDGIEDDKRRGKIGAVELYTISGSFVVLWLSSFLAFTRNINQTYLHTFFGTMTAPQYTIHAFKNGTSDHKLLMIFNVYPLYWESIRGEVQAYTFANWDRWKAEKPDWFTDNFIATIPDEFIPRVDKDRRRSSALGNLLGLPAAEKAIEGRGRGGRVAAVEAVEGAVETKE